MPQAETSPEQQSLLAMLRCPLVTFPGWGTLHQQEQSALCRAHGFVREDRQVRVVPESQ